MSQAEDDLRCLQRMQAGDERALEELHSRYSPLMHGLARRIVHSPQDAEEVVQQAWVQAWKESAQHDPRRGSVAAWLVTMTRSRALDLVRSHASKRRVEEHVEAEPVAPREDPAAAAVRSQIGARVRAALGALEPRQRQVLEIACFEGLSQSEIAARIDAPLGTVKSWMRQGLGRLREALPREDWA